MAGTNALTGARFPSSGDAPAVYQDIQNAVNDLSDDTCPAFTSSTTRNTAFTNWVAAGNTMRNGLLCSVAGVPQIYRSGAWHGVAPQAFSTTTADTTLTTSTRTLMTLTVPDPGWSYVLQVSGSVTLAILGVGVSAQPQIKVGGTFVPPYGSIIANSGGSDITGVVLNTFSPGNSAVLTGAATVTLEVVKVAGPAGNGFQGKNPDNANVLTAIVIPA